MEKRAFLRGALENRTKERGAYQDPRTCMWLCRELRRFQRSFLGVLQAESLRMGPTAFSIRLVPGPLIDSDRQDRRGAGETGNKEVDGCFVLSCEFTWHLQPSPVISVLVAFRPAAAFTSRTSGTSLYPTFIKCLLFT